MYCISVRFSFYTKLTLSISLCVVDGYVAFKCFDFVQGSNGEAAFTVQAIVTRVFCFACKIILTLSTHISSRASGTHWYRENKSRRKKRPF